MAQYLLPIGLLVVSNMFMTLAWYGHLKYPAAPLYAVVFVAWGIAFFEYWLAVPANRIGHQVYSAAQLKTIQEVITLIVFAGFSVLYLREAIGWQIILGFAFIAIGAGLVFMAPKPQSGVAALHPMSGEATPDAPRSEDVSR